MSTTTNIGLFKHDNPATNTDEFNVDKALNQNWDKVDTAIGTDRERITKLESDNTTNKQDITEIKAKDTDQDKYIAELEAENTRLREDLNGLPKGQASGESIDLSDSAEMRCDLKISGNSKQETREGYNLLPNNLDSQTINNVTVTINKDKSITLNGTASAYFQLILFNDTDKPIKLSNGTYTISYKNKPTGLNLIGTENGIDVPYMASAVTTQSITKTYTSETIITKIVTAVASGTVFNNLTVYPMIYSGTEEKDYEQYGASPSPDYPSEVESCGDNVNLLNWGENLIKNIAWKETGESYTTTNTIGTSDFIKIIKSITISYNGKIASGNLGRFNTYDKNKNFVATELITSLPYTRQFNSNEEYYTFHFVSSYISYESELKLELGEVATPYSPYGQGCINEVICNKNMFDENNKLINATINASGEIVTGQDNYLFYIPVKYGYNYAFSFDSSESLTTNIVYGYCNEIPKVGSIATYNIISMSNLNNKLFTPTDSKNKYLCLRLNYKTQYNKMSNIQLEEGQATPYIEHKSQTYTIPTQQPMRSVGDIRDTFIKKDGKRFERHYVSRKIFDGTENFVLSGSLKNTNRFSTNNYKSTFKNAMSSHFKYAYDYNLDEPHFYLNSSSLFLFVNNTISTVAELQAYLAEQYNAGTPVYVDYILETPLDIECTEEQSTILWDIEQNAKTYDKVTHMYSTDKISPYKEVTYKKDIETLFENTLVS